MSTAHLSASAAVSGSAMTLRSRPRRFYVGMALLMIVFVVAGFWASYFGSLFRGVIVARPWVIHLHFAVFMGWMALLLTQVILVSLGRTRVHQKLGTFGIGYGFLVLFIGLVVTFAAPILHVTAGEWEMDRAASFIILPLGDMVLFAGLFGAAVRYRNQPEIHKRLILLATVALLFAAAARLAFEGPRLILLLLWLSPLLVAIGYDGITRRRIHPVYLIGLTILLAGFSRVFFMQSEAWLNIGRAMLSAFM